MSDEERAGDAKPPGSEEDKSNTDSTSDRKSHPARWSGLISGIVCGLLTSILVSFYFTATGQATLNTITHHLTKPSCNDPQWLLQVPDNAIFASSYYFQQDTIPDYNSLHSPNLTIDGDLNTSWLQFWPSPSTFSSNENSDYIEWTFPQTYDVRLICVVDGWSEDRHTYVATLPIGTAKVYVTNPAAALPPIGLPSISNQCASRTEYFKDYLEADGAISDSYQWQGVPFHCNTSNIVLHIMGVSSSSMKYRAGRLDQAQLGQYKASLTGLSEIRFYYCPAMLCFLPTQ